MFSHHDLATLNDLEMQVYQYIIKHRDSVSYMTIRELAEQAAVSTTTVLRFCRKMQCEGWSEFRIRLRLAREQTAPALPVSGIADMLSFFKSINNDEFEQVIHRAVGMINQAERVFFIGVGTSGSLGKYGARFFQTWANSATRSTIPIIRSVRVYMKMPWPLFFLSPAKRKRCCALPVSST
ncbi:transcriptional regulator, RpiR family [Pantoea ananatis LMG 5342]|nr:transcriptional regulator, RpiR family [Pantoea ananatis LMG 5342]